MGIPKSPLGTKSFKPMLEYGFVHFFKKMAKWGDKNKMHVVPGPTNNNS
jgi:hypothetical protein